LINNILIGTGIPATMMSAVFLLDQLEPDIILPGVGTKGCFLTSEGNR
jgi:hypothetical protein